MELYNGDCLELMKNIPDKSIDMICCDLPYGVTRCEWDLVIPIDKLWQEYNRIIKDDGIIALFGTEPFSSLLRISNLKMFRYDWIWEKEVGSNFQNAKRQPLKVHEIISIFGKKNKYYPQGLKETNVVKSNKNKSLNLKHIEGLRQTEYTQTKTNYPRSIVKYKRDRGLHATQKPVALLEYLIKTYTHENQIVLDNTMGSGSTGIVCINTNRYFIGMELDKEIFEIAKDRIEKHMSRSVSEG